MGESLPIKAHFSVDANISVDSINFLDANISVNANNLIDAYIL
jgi:hypothetical protein